MADLPTVPLMLSLEGRAELIADVAGHANFGKASDRREAVKAEALAHLRVVAAKASEGDR
jgi:hypothetical protein